MFVHFTQKGKIINDDCMKYFGGLDKNIHKCIFKKYSFLSLNNLKLVYSYSYLYSWK